MSSTDRVLMRNEAAQMSTDLRTAISNLIGLAGEMGDTDKVFAMDTLVLLQTKQNVLDNELAWSKRAGVPLRGVRGTQTPAPGTVFDEPAGLARQERVSSDAVEALRLALAAHKQGATEADYAGSALLCTGLARAAQIAATELTKTAACYEMAAAIGRAEDTGGDT